MSEERTFIMGILRRFEWISWLLERILIPVLGSPTRGRLTGLQLHSVEFVFDVGKHIDAVVIRKTSEDREEKSCKTERRQLSRQGCED